MMDHVGEHIAQAALYAGFAQASFIAGAILAWRVPSLTRPLWIGLIMAFGAGAVISAMSIDLVAVSYREAGVAPTAFGVLIGGVGYFLFIRVLDRSGAIESIAEADLEGPRPPTAREGRNLLIGAAVDGAPESIAIGLTLHMMAAGVSAALVGAVFVSGIPQALGISAALLASGARMRRILVRFSGLVVLGAVFGVVGYQLLEGAPHGVTAVIQSIAAGAMIVVVVNEMVPIAVRSAERWAGLAAMLGFVFAATVTWLYA